MLKKTLCTLLLVGAYLCPCTIYIYTYISCFYYVCVNLGPCMHLHLFVRGFACRCVRKINIVFLWMYVCAYVRACVRACVLCMYICVSVWEFPRESMFVHACLCVSLYVSVCVSTWPSLSVSVSLSLDQSPSVYFRQARGSLMDCWSLGGMVVQELALLMIGPRPPCTLHLTPYTLSASCAYPQPKA